MTHTVTPATPPRSDAHKDWFRLFLFVTHLDMMVVAHFDMLHATAQLQIVHPMLSSVSPMLVQQGQLLPFDPSAGTLSACHK